MKFQVCSIYNVKLLIRRWRCTLADVFPISGTRALNPMAFHASRRLSAAAGPKLSSLFAHREVPKPRPPLPPESSNYSPRRKPRPRPRQPWGEDAAALLRRLHEGRYLPGPDLSMAAHVVSPDAVKTASERFGNDHQVVAKWVPLLLFLSVLQRACQLY
jgi:hypothetical protein